MPEKSAAKLKSVHLTQTTHLQLLAWHFRRATRNLLGRDVLDVTDGEKRGRSKAREVYRRVDQFMTKYLPNIKVETPHGVALKRVRDVLQRDLEYIFSDVDEARPWGAYYRIVDEQVGRFMAEFFPDLNPVEAHLGRDDIKLSPKIILVYPGQRLSWQYHNRRAERWRFLTSGNYYRSHSDEPGEPQQAQPDQIIQFDAGERHRLCASDSGYTLVAEIWQHTKPDEPSDEADIVRVHDDYKR